MFWEKLQQTSFVNHTMNIICCYLMDASQYIQVAEKKLKLLAMFFVVPQDSILGTLQFNLCVTELVDRVSPTSM